MAYSNMGTMGHMASAEHHGRDEERGPQPVTDRGEIAREIDYVRAELNQMEDHISMLATRLLPVLAMQNPPETPGVQRVCVTELGKTIGEFASRVRFISQTITLLCDQVQL